MNNWWLRTLAPEKEHQQFLGHLNTLLSRTRGQVAQQSVGKPTDSYKLNAPKKENSKEERRNKASATATCQT